MFKQAKTYYKKNMFLNQDCLNYVLSFVNEKDKNSTFTSSKKLYNWATKNGGWKKYISFESNMSHKDFVKLCSFHKVALKRLKIKNITNPVDWVPLWPEEVIFENCRMKKKEKSIMENYFSKIKEKIDEKRSWDSKKGFGSSTKKIKIIEDGIMVICVY
jgi:hypothetical protein